MKHTLLAVLLFTSTAAISQDFSGTYYSDSEMGRLLLSLRNTSGVHYEGKLTSESGLFAVRGSVGDHVLSGTAEDEFGLLGFQAEIDKDNLELTIFELDDEGRIVEGTEETLFFMKSGADGTTQPEITGGVTINGVQLSENQIDDLEKTYGIRPKAGNYWYDLRSGLYGAVGYPSFGFMLPEHEYGMPAQNASNGDTGVFVNGRELPASEYTVWSYMVGSWIQPGRYWLDHQGNAGYEGNPLPVINLYTAAQQNAYAGQGGSGDNFWSTRFSAGNYNAGNTQGYVSVPGYGPIGYGF